MDQEPTKVDKKGHSIIYRLRHRKNNPLIIKTRQRTIFLAPGHEATDSIPVGRLKREYGFVIQYELF